MYIFGGCNSGKTTFNDMWTFDLSQRQWIRPISSGNYPPPKACCSLVSYKDKLILFGGWTHSSSNRIHDSWKLFNHIHEFDTKTSRWSLIEVMSDCPPMAGHKACIYGIEMIVFGGLQSLENAPYNYLASNDVFAFNISGHTWRKVNTDGPKPPPRYGHSQLVIDDHLIVLGGSSGPKKFLSDFWILDMRTEPWTWHPIEVNYSQSSEPPIIGTNPVCKVDDLLVCLGRNVNSKSSPSLNDVNFFKKILDRHRCKPCGSTNRPRYRLQPQPSQLERRKLMSSGRYVTTDNETNTINKPIINSRSIESTKSPQSKGVKPIKLTTQKSHFSPNSHDALFLYTLDISRIVTEKKVTWLPQENHVPGPQQLLLYSLVVGDSEIIMFGGVRLENGLSNNSSVSNSIYIVTAQKTII
ncbi:F-box only protein 42-like isoform X2 [Panonychus citri]|nr:F-box only protein 42-like isoform X2 [Panonychus citri]